MVASIFLVYKEQNPTILICGPSSFVDAATIAFISATFNPANIRTERFG
jgi:ferredoxin-NADP reductase